MRKFVKVLGTLLGGAWIGFGAYMLYRNLPITVTENYKDLIEGIKWCMIGLTAGIGCITGAWALQFVGIKHEIPVYRVEEKKADKEEKKVEASKENEEVSKTGQEVAPLQEKAVDEAKEDVANVLKEARDNEGATEEKVAELNQKVHDQVVASKTEAEDAIKTAKEDVRDTSKEEVVDIALNRAIKNEVQGNIEELDEPIIKPEDEEKMLKDIPNPLPELKEEPVEEENIFTSDDEEDFVKPYEVHHNKESDIKGFFARREAEMAKQESVEKKKESEVQKVEEPKHVVEKAETKEEPAVQKDIKNPFAEEKVEESVKEENTEVQEKEEPVAQHKEEAVVQKTESQKYVTPKFFEVYKQVGGKTYDLRKAPCYKDSDGISHINIEGNFFKFDGKGNIYDDEPWGEK